MFSFEKLIALVLAIITISSPTFSQCSNTFLETREIVLQQEEQVLGNIESATTLGDGFFAVATADPGIFLFDSQGSFVRQLGQPGRGPGEYQGSLIVRSVGDTVAVWDAGNRKLMLFSRNGEVLREWTQIGRAVSEYSVRYDTLFAYHSGGLNENYVSLYRYGNRGTADVRLGNAPGEHFSLSLLDGSAALTYNDNYGLLLYASPAEQRVHIYDPKASSTEQFRIEDPKFDVGAVSKYTTLNDVNSNLLKAAEQAFRSSRFYFLQTFGDYVLSVLQHGELRYEKSFAGSVRSRTRRGSRGGLDVGEVEENSRVFNVHLHTVDGSSLACESLSLSEMDVESDSPIVGPTPRGFLILKTRTKEKTLDYILTEYSVPNQSIRE